MRWYERSGDCWWPGARRRGGGLVDLLEAEVLGVRGA